MIEHQVERQSRLGRKAAARASKAKLVKPAVSNIER